jgi:hypothetical protein
MGEKVRGERDERKRRGRTSKPLRLLSRQPPRHNIPRRHMLTSLSHQPRSKRNDLLDEAIPLVGLDQSRLSRLTLDELETGDLGVVALFRVENVVKGELPEGDEEGGAKEGKKSQQGREEREEKTTDPMWVRAVSGRCSET